MLKDCQDLIHLFNRLFQQAEQTILVGGASEPLYLPKTTETPYHQIFFTYDYYSSALHEIAHWSVAGIERRQLVDYGYWYKPDGRDTNEQQLFEQVEIKPQAIEWIFSVAAGVSFRVSADNIAGNNIASDTFKKNIYLQVLTYMQNGLPTRAELFRQALIHFYKTTNLFKKDLFLIETL